MKKLFLLLIFLLIAGFSGFAHGRPNRLTDFNTRYGTAPTALNTCSVCHTVPDPIAGNGPRNPYGIDLFNNFYDFAIVEPRDSDGDGASNITEITARTFPGDPNSRPVPSDGVPPTVTSFLLPLTFDVPNTATTLTVPITSFTAVDNAGGSGVAGFMITESALPPSSTGPGWNPAPPADFTFATPGQKTLFAWARDAAGNVSSSLSAPVTIALAPGRTYLDVPTTHFAFAQIEQIAAAGITAGCSVNPPLYCPELPISRAQMAVYIETSLGVAAGVLPPCSGTVFGDVTVAAVGDVFCRFIEDLAASGISGGCQPDNPATPGENEARFCPNDPVTRAQMAVFVETALGVLGVPACLGTVFSDVTAAGMGSTFCGYIEDFAAKGITTGCQADNPATTTVNEGRYCPDEQVTRAQMAVFVVTAPAPLLP